MKLVISLFLLLAVLPGFAACNDNDDAGSEPTAASPAVSRPAGLDTSFGVGGIAQVAISTTANDRFMAAAFAADGSIFATGFITQAGDNAMVLAKLTASGALDRSFGTGGFVTVNVASGGKTAEIARSIVILPIGKILIAGPVEHDPSAAGDAARDTDIAVLRFDGQGKLDTSFGQEGMARIDLGEGRATSATAFVGDSSWGMAALPGDRVVIMGSKLSTASADRSDADYVIFSLTAAGALDTAFGNGGTVVVDAKNSADNARGILVQPDGKIVATGFSAIDGVVSPVLIRMSAAGVLDPTFGTAGVATAKVLAGVAESYAVALQGSSYVSAGYGRGSDAAEKVDLIVDRWKADGSWDTTFGDEGVARLDLAKDDDRARNLRALPDGRILVVGSGKLTATNVDAMVLLLGEDGDLEASFGTSGHILSDLGGPADSWYGLALSPDGKSAIVVGYKGVDATSGGNDDAVVARINL